MDRDLPISPWPEWNIIGKAGEGSYGRVYKAERSERGHSFYSAIKVISIPENREELNSILAETENEDAARQYFENVMEDCIREISTMENFRGNSYVVAVEDFKVVEYLDEIGWDIFIRMEYLQSFQDHLSGKNIDEEQIIKLGCDLCRALMYCGRFHLIHRDINPENIFVSRFGDYKLGDFGIAREMEKSMGGLSRKGTSSYMAPEMYHGELCDNRVDIYSLGLVMYRLCNRNRLPFLSLEKQLITYRDKENALVKRMSGEAFPDPCDAAADLKRVILKACAYDPNDRYRTPGEMLEDLEKVQRSRTEEPASSPASVPAEGTVPEYREPTVDYERPVTKKRTVRKRTRDNPYAAGTPSWLPLAIIAVLVIAVGAVLIGFYLKKMVEDTVREQTEKMIASLQNQSEVTSEDSSMDFASSLSLISERATAIVEELPGYHTDGTEGQRLRYYNDEEELRKVLVYPALSDEGMYEEYYYWHGSLFFAYIWKDDQEELYYYRDGMLIRWIDKDGGIHDEEYDNEEYEERGDRYWTKAIIQAEM